MSNFSYNYTLNNSYIFPYWEGTSPPYIAFAWMIAISGLWIGCYYLNRPQIPVNEAEFERLRLQFRRNTVILTPVLEEHKAQGSMEGPLLIEEPTLRDPEVKERERTEQSEGPRVQNPIQNTAEKIQTAVQGAQLPYSHSDTQLSPIQSSESPANNRFVFIHPAHSATSLVAAVPTP